MRLIEKIKSINDYVDLIVIPIPLIVSIFLVGKIFGIGNPTLITPLCLSVLATAFCLYYIIVSSNSAKDMAIGVGKWLLYSVLATAASLIILAIVGILLIGLIIDLALLLFSGGIEGALSSSGGSSSSSSSSESDLWGYDENGSAHKLTKTGGGYARDEQGRQWTNIDGGGNKYRLDE